MRPPFEWPLSAPSLDELAAGYGREPSKYLFAVSELGSDFETYVIKHACETLVLPDQDRLIARRAEQLRRECEQLRQQLLAELHQDEAAEISEQVDALLTATCAGGRRQPDWKPLHGKLSGRAAEIGKQLAHAAWQTRRRHDPVRPDPDLVGRWIAARVLTLGWTPDRFRNIDQRLAQLRSYESPGVERFGKKYAWIAFYQALGHLAAHCQVQDHFHDEPHAYEGPWQIVSARDIDPSIALRGDEPPNRNRGRRRASAPDRHEPSWWLRAYRHRLPETGDHDAWLDDPSDVPDHLALLVARDPYGDEWVAVENHVTWDVRHGTGASDRIWRQQWVRSQAYLVGQEDLPRLRRWAKRQNWMGLWLPTPPEFARGLLGEYPDLTPWPDYLALAACEGSGVPFDAPPDPHLGWATVKTHGITCRMALATAYYSKDTSRDYSAITLPSCHLPAPALIGLLEARWKPAPVPDPTYGLGPTEQEYSWYNNDGLVAFATGGTGSGAPSVLWIRAEPLRAGLRRDGLALWAWSLGEKIPWDGPMDASPERTEIYGAHELGPDAASTWKLTISRIHSDDDEDPEGLGHSE